MSNKIVFTKTELNKFLLLGDTGEYLIDKINPCIRAIKRKEILSIFCTLRIKKNTTSVKLGEFPKKMILKKYIVNLKLQRIYLLMAITLILYFHL